MLESTGAVRRLCRLGRKDIAKGYRSVDYISILTLTKWEWNRCHRSALHSDTLWIDRLELFLIVNGWFFLHGSRSIMNWDISRPELQSYPFPSHHVGPFFRQWSLICLWMGFSRWRSNVCRSTHWKSFNTNCPWMSKCSPGNAICLEQPATQLSIWSLWPDYICTVSNHFIYLSTSSDLMLAAQKEPSMLL